MHRVVALSVLLLQFVVACGDDDRSGADATTDSTLRDGASSSDASTPVATLGPQGEAYRARCEFFCDGKGDPSDACPPTEREECVLACQSRLALVETPCATCILDEAFIETFEDPARCRYFVLEEKESGACASFCGGASPLADGADRTARCRGFCAADAYGTRCIGDHLDSCTAACVGRTELLSLGCSSCLIDEFSAEELDGGRCRFFFDEVSIEACAGSCSSETATPSSDQLDRRCEHFCTGNGGGYNDGCPAAETERCLSACRSQVDGLNSGCAACVLDTGFIEPLDDARCRFSFGEIAGAECTSFCVP